MSARWTHEIRWLFAFFCGCLAVLPVHSVAQPVSSQPFPMVEAGMHTAKIEGIAVDAAGRYAVTASHDKTARVWDLATNKLLAALRVPVGDGDEGKLYAVALSPGGGLIALGGWTGPTGLKESIDLLDRVSGRMLGRISGLPNPFVDGYQGRFAGAAARDDQSGSYRKGVRRHRPAHPPFARRPLSLRGDSHVRAPARDALSRG